MGVDTGTLVIKGNDSNLLERGFKARSENISALIRSKIGIVADAPLEYQRLAEYLSVDIIELANLRYLDAESKTYLASEAGREWSAVTVANPQRVIVVTNPSHSRARRSSSTMHELAHIILEHTPCQIFVTEADLALRDYDDKQEAEADWLAGALLLPRVALQKLAYGRTSRDQALDEYAVSPDLYEYRKRMTGIAKQFK